MLQPVVPDFGGQEDLVAGYIMGVQGGAHGLFVFVHLGGVDVAVAQVQGLVDAAHQRLALEPEGAQPQGREGCLGHVLSLRSWLV